MGIGIGGNRMSEQETAILDGNEACARVAYRLSQVITIYPITPSSTMAEYLCRRMGML